MSKSKVIILRTAGTNCDYETQTAFELAGAAAERIHINKLISGQIKLSDYQILAIPGGFSYGDDIASGKILANELKYKLGEQLKEFALSGKPIIGICNGFQVLVKMGLLPDNGNPPVSPFSKGGVEGDLASSHKNNAFIQTATLTFNDSDKFECRWVYLKTIINEQLSMNNERRAKCLWVEKLPEIISLPVAHGEGKFVAGDKNILDEIEKNNQVVFRYANENGKLAGYPFNPNGAVNSIAGICNLKGNVFGLMPHPERFIYAFQHPNRVGNINNSEYGWGLEIFKNAINFVK